jgi:hypothetical protein
MRVYWHEVKEVVSSTLSLKLRTQSSVDSRKPMLTTGYLLLATEVFK